MFKITARTILELGAELISSDIIAFYELIKNAFDAKSTSGADISFNIVLRRNDYLSIRSNALEPVSEEATRGERRRLEGVKLTALIDKTTRSLDPGAGYEAVSDFTKRIADATDLDNFVEKFDEAYKVLNTITIADTGTGMSLRQLSDNYLTIGTPSRKKEVDRAISDGNAKVPYLGEKGIGRLSAMRLGNRLHLESARAEDRNMNILDIDWAQFANLDAMVEDINLEPQRGKKKEIDDWSGTRLIIGDLAEDWTRARVERLAEYDFARIGDPFLDPKRRPRIAIRWNADRVAIKWLDKLLFDQAHASFDGKYEIEDGAPTLTVRFDAYKLGYEHPHEFETVKYSLPELEGLFTGTSQELPISALTAVGPFSFKAYWYNRRNLTGIDTIGNQKEVRELQRKWSGIMLFRDGFRVFPYGEDDDDWLGLDRKALARPGYVLNKAQFVGHVQISRAANPKLVDQTNREGLRATPEQELFIAILQHVVREMLWSFLRDMDRRYKRQPIDLGDMKAEINTLETRARTALTKVRKLVPKDEIEVVDDLQLAIAELRDLSTRAQRRIEEVESDSRQMVQMAGVGLMVEVVAHELARASESALGALEALRGRDLPTEVKSRLDLLRAEMKSVSKRLRVLDQMSVSGRQRSEIFDLGDLIEDLQEGHAAQFKRHGIIVDVKKPKGPLRVKVVKGMVVQILENLLSNSIYWMQLRADRESGYVPRISIKVESDPPTIRFSDNGKGIAPDHQERIFRAFWSLKEKSKRRGLGLFIARENATYLGGSLVLSDKEDRETGRLHEFIFELPEGVEVS